jgi:hypothetical protein
MKAVINLVAYFMGWPDEERQRFVSEYTLSNHMVQVRLLAECKLHKNFCRKYFHKTNSKYSVSYGSHSLEHSLIAPGVRPFIKLSSRIRETSTGSAATLDLKPK